MNSFRSGLENGSLHVPGSIMPAKRPKGANEAAGLTSIPVNREAKRIANHRHGDRHRLQSERVRARVGRKLHDVELINLSGGGAMIRTDVPLEMWQRIQLLLGECNALECAVRWIKGGRVGLEFAHETQIGGDKDKRDALLLEVINRSFVGVAHLPEPIPSEPKKAKTNVPTTKAHRRAALRHPLIWSGEVHFDHQSTPVRLRNISESGVLADCAMPFKPDAEVLLDLGGAGQHFARVCWSFGDQVGLKFVEPFDISCLAKAKPDLTNHQWAAPDYLRTGRDNRSAWAKDWRANSLPEIRDSLEGFLKR